MIKNNYLLRDKSLLLRQTLAAWIILFVGVTIFSIVAAVLTKFVHDSTIVIAVSFLVTSPLIVGAHWLLFSYERKWFEFNRLTKIYKAMPSDTRLVAIKKGIKEISSDVNHLREDMVRLQTEQNRLLTDITNLRVKARRRNLDVSDLNNLENRVLENRRKSSLLLDDLLSARQHINQNIERLSETNALEIWIGTRRYIDNLSKERKRVYRQKRSTQTIQRKYRSTEIMVGA